MANRKKEESGQTKGEKETKNRDQGRTIFYSRKYSRVPIEMEVEYKIGEKYLRGQSRDISPGGMYIKSKTPLPDGIETEVRFVLDKEKLPIEVKGRVAWSSSGEERKRDTHPEGMGIEFVEDDEGKRKVIGEFVRDITDLMRIMAITNKRRDS